MKKDSVIEVVRQMVEQIPIAQSFGFADFGVLATTRRRGALAGAGTDGQGRGDPEGIPGPVLPAKGVGPLRPYGAF